jgi:hypothetical protein
MGSASLKKTFRPDKQEITGEWTIGGRTKQRVYKYHGNLLQNNNSMEQSPS